MHRFRPNVAAILQNSEGKILVCERIDIGGAWQFPQGGIDPGETPRQALEREMVEELSLGPEHYQIKGQKGPYRYLIGEGKTKKGYHGQEQEYFLLHLTGDEAHINVKTPDQEFISCKWIHPAQFDAGWLPPMKVEVYRQVMRDFFGVEIRNDLP